MKFQPYHCVCDGMRLRAADFYAQFDQERLKTLPTSLAVKLIAEEEHVTIGHEPVIDRAIVSVPTEEEYFRLCGVNWLPPEKRF